MKKYLSTKTFFVAIVFSLIIASSFAYMLYHGIILFNNPSKKKYPVRGVDVSHYQGNVDWGVLSQEGIYFVFIKATEGSKYIDNLFQYNYENALKTNLRVGAYHFFSTESKAQTQAQNFIATVKRTDNMLPPVVDFEIDSVKLTNQSSCDSIRLELSILLNDLEKYYNLKPIIYTTEELYDLYISGYYSDYSIWIRNIFTTPKKLYNQEWAFWQYTSRKKLKGYDGTQQYIDMNVFNGSVDEFNHYAK